MHVPQFRAQARCYPILELAWTPFIHHSSTVGNPQDAYSAQWKLSTLLTVAQQLALHELGEFIFKPSPPLTPIRLAPPPDLIEVYLHPCNKKCVNECGPLNALSILVSSLQYSFCWFSVLAIFYDNSPFFQLISFRLKLCFFIIAFVLPIFHLSYLL